MKQGMLGWNWVPIDFNVTMPEWDQLEPSGNIDAAMRMILVLFFVGWNAIEALSLRTPYPSTMVALWHSPMWRFIFLMAVWLGAEWCPRVGIMSAIAVVFYAVNMIQIT